MKILSILLLALLCIPQTLFAHPLDISSSSYTIAGREVTAVTYFHTYEAERLLRSNGVNLDTSEDYYKNSAIFERYVRERASVQNNGKDCTIQDIKLIRKEMYEIISEGLGMEYGFTCDSPIETISIDLRFFIEYELQTNRLRLYNGDKGVDNNVMAYKVLNPLVTRYAHNLSDTEVKKLADTDGDMIPDEEERIYRTDISKLDTDGDFYTDYEEVTMGWNPINASPSPGQTKRDTLPEAILSPPDGIRQLDSYDVRFIKDTNLLDTGFGNVQLRDTLKAITEAFRDISFGSFWYVFGLVMLLGFIHAIGPGHSKGFLVSYVLDREKGFWQGLVFVTVFSLVHLADIVFLFLITKLFFSLYDPTQYMVVIQQVSIVILFFFSIYVFIQSVRKLRARKEKGSEVRGQRLEIRDRELKNTVETSACHVSGEVRRENKQGTKGIKGGIFMAFVAGLAPCSFGWSIFLVLFSMGEIVWILPLLWALALGIWLCLFCILLVTLFFRDRLYKRFSVLPDYSSVVSSFILILLSAYLFSLLI